MLPLPRCCDETLAPLSVVLPLLAAAAFPILSALPRVGGSLAISVAVAAPCATLALLALASPSILVSSPAPSRSVTSVGALLEFRLDALSLLLACLTSFVGALSLTFGTRYLSPHNRAYAVQSLNKSYPLSLLMIGTLIGLYFSGNLLTLLVFWELASLCTYALVAFRPDSPASVRAGLKTLLMTHVGGVGLVTATLVLYAQTRGFGFPDTAPGELELGPLYALTALAIAAALPKAEQYPLHTWFLDAAVAPTTSIVIFSVCGSQASVYLLSRLLQPLYLDPPHWEPVRLAATSIGAVTVLVGGVGGLLEDSLKRTIAYAKVAGMGFIVMGLGLLTPLSLAAALTLVVSHALAFTLLFFGAGSVLYAVGDESLERLGGLYQRMKLTAIGFLVGCLTLASVPSTPEFIGKYLLLQASLEAGYLHLLPVIVLGSLLNAAVGARLFYAVFLGGERRGPRIEDPPPPMLAPMLVLAAATLLVGSYPKLVLENWVLPALVHLGARPVAGLYEHFYTFASVLVSLVAALVAIAIAALLAVTMLTEEASSGGEGEAEEAAKLFLCGVDFDYTPMPGGRIYSHFLSAVKLAGLALSIDPDRFHNRLAASILNLAKRALALDIHYSYRASILTFLAAALALLLIAGALACL